MITREELPALAIAIVQLLFLPVSFAQMFRKIFKTYEKTSNKKTNEEIPKQTGF